MTGKTHWKIGALSYGIIAMLSGAEASLLTPVAIVSAALGSLIPDADESNSIGNKLNPVTAPISITMKLLRSLLSFAIKLLLTVGTSGIILMIASMIAVSGVVKDVGYLLIVYVFCILLSLTFFLKKKTFVHIPLIGYAYEAVIGYLNKGMNNVKKILIKGIYIFVALLLFLNNTALDRDIIIYLSCLYIIGIGLFPHRKFTHSIDGGILFTLIAYYVFNSAGHLEIGLALITGYLSHIYWSDIFTVTGVPVSFIPTIIEKIGLTESLLTLNNKYITKIYTVLSIELKLPIMKTGSNKGKWIEIAYVGCLIIIFAVMYLLNHDLQA